MDLALPHGLSNEVKWLWDLVRQKNPSTEAAGPCCAEGRGSPGSLGLALWTNLKTLIPHSTGRLSKAKVPSFIQHRSTCDVRQIISLSDTAERVSGLLNVTYTGALSLSVYCRTGTAPTQWCTAAFSRTRAQHQPVSVPACPQPSSSVNFLQDLSAGKHAPLPPSCPLSTWGPARWTEPSNLTLRCHLTQGRVLSLLPPCALISGQAQ